MSAEAELGEEEHRRIATEMYERWAAGEKKSQLEIEYWDNPTSHGKAFSAYVKKWLGRSTERKSGQTQRIEHLEALLRASGVSPTDDDELDVQYRLLAKARESALSAVRVYNDPLAGFRTETFILLMIVAWNSALQAVLERDGVPYFACDDEGHEILIGGRPKVLDTWELVKVAIGGDRWTAVRANLDFFLGLRNCVAHRYLPAVDPAVAGEAQAMLLNFEKLITTEFGEEAALGERLTVPLQLSRFRGKGSLDSLRAAQAQLPADVSDYLTRHRAEQPSEVLQSEDYCLDIFFVPVTANRERTADAVVRFIRPDQVTSELEAQLQDLGVITKRRVTPVASADLLRVAEVVQHVAEKLPFRFTTDTHTRCWRHYGVRPRAGVGEPAATDDRYCRWDRLSNGYGYTQAWVEKLIRDLSDPDKYEAVVGFRPE